MNQLIEQLAEQCYEKHPILETFQFDKHKFAELIIRECLGDLKERIALRYQGSDRDRDIGYGMEIVYWEIVDKFGVEA
jgi:hypothetical protein